MIGRVTRMSLLATLALALALAPACARQPAPETSAEPSSASKPVTPTPAPEPLAERMMPFAQRQAEMPVGMPVEIPVIAGAVVSTSAPVSDSSWLYAIETSGTAESAALWYQRAYENAGWVLAEGGRAEGGNIVLDLRKGGAESKLRIVETGPTVRVEASIGVGDRAPSAF